MDSAVTRREEMKERVSFIDAADILGAGARSARPATATPRMIEAISRGSVSATLIWESSIYPDEFLIPIPRQKMNHHQSVHTLTLCVALCIRF